MKRYIPFEVDFNCKVVGDKETIRVQAVMLEDLEGPYVNFSDVERLIAERDAAVVRLRDYEDDYRAVVNEQCAGDEKHCACVPHLRQRIKAVEAERDAAVADADLHRTRCASILFSGAMDDKLVSEVQWWVRDYVDAKAERDAAVKLLQAVLNIQDMSDADLEQLRLNCKAAIDAVREKV